MKCGVFLLILHVAHGAFIGDGRHSVLTGRALDVSDASGSCSLEGQSYLSETFIPREDPCHYCLCIQGKVDCYWKSCPSAPDGCIIFNDPNTCNPSLYVCDIPVILSRLPTTLTARKVPDEVPLSVDIPKRRARDHRSPLVTPRTREPSLHHNLLSSPKGEESMVVEQRPHPPAPEKRRPPVLPPSRRIAPPSRRIAPPSERPTRRVSPRTTTRNKRIPPSFSQRREDFVSPLVSTDVNDPLRLPISRLGRQSSLRPSFRVRRSITSGSAPFNDEFPEALMLQAVERKIGLHRHKRAISEARVQNKVDTSCSILGVQYNLGETIGVASNVCLECRCAAGSLYCSPKCCFNPAGVSAADAQKYLGASSSRTPRVSREHPLQHLLEEVGGLLNR